MQRGTGPFSLASRTREFRLTPPPHFARTSKTAPFALFLKSCINQHNQTKIQWAAFFRDLTDEEEYCVNKQRSAKI